MTLQSLKLFVMTASKCSFLSLGIILLFVCLSCLLFAEPPQLQSPLPPPSGMMMEMDNHLHGAFYSIGEGWKSTLVLNNVIGSTSRARVTLYSKHGRPLAVPEITLNPHENRYFNVADWLTGDDGDIDDFSEGSVEVFFHGISMSVGAQLLVSNERRGLSFDVHFDEDMDFASAQLESVWWGLNDETSARVFLTNTRQSKITVTPTFQVGGESLESESIVLDGHEMQTLDIAEALKKLKVKRIPASGGITLRQDNLPGSLVVVGALLNKQSRFSSTLRFVDLSTQHTSTLHGAHLLIGKASADSGLPIGATYTPRATIRNTTNGPVEIKTTVRFTTVDGSQSLEIPFLILSPNEVHDLDLSAAVSALGTKDLVDAGIEIQHNGQPGAIIAAAASVDRSGGRVFDVPIKDPKGSMFGGGSYPWRIDGDNRAVVHLKNVDPMTDGKPRTAIVKIWFEGGSYTLPVVLADAGQTVSIDLKKLRDDQVKDGTGKVLPLNVTKGQLEWHSRGVQGQFIGRLVEYNPTTGISSSFSCGFVCMCETTYSSGFVAPSSFVGFPGDTANLQAFENDYDCNGNPVTYNVTSLAIFTSGNSSIASVSGSTVTLGSSGGATSINASWDTTVVLGAMTCDQELNVNGCPGCDSQASLGSGSMAATTSLPKFTVQYASFIPFDHAPGPTPCITLPGISPPTSLGIGLIYKGDANRGTYRTTESLDIVLGAGQSGNFFQDTGLTSNYGWNSPANGSTLSDFDEDGKPGDCLLWNGTKKAPVAFLEFADFPSIHQGRVDFSGAGANPLEPDLGAITWIMSTLVDTSNRASPTATVTYNHTCYPAHQIKVNGKVVYKYIPTFNDVTRILGCLTGTLSAISGQTPPVAIAIQ
jgi:hypothetical protein